MTRSILLLIVAFLLLAKQPLTSQTTTEHQYLQKVGIIDSLYSESLNENRTFYVQYPLDYNPQSTKKYPVAYIIDGDFLLPTVHDVQNYYSGGFTPEMILIGVSNLKNRNRDLTPSKITEMDGRPYPYESGASDNFSDFIENELIPFVEQKYPITNYRTLIGHSYGGLYTIDVLLNRPHLFSNYLAIDPSIEWDNQVLLKEAQLKLPTQDYKGKTLYMTMGGQLHMQDPTITIDNVMQDNSNFTIFGRSIIELSQEIEKNKDNGLAFEWKFYPNDLHGTIPFPSVMDGLVSIFQWYQMENVHKFNIPETSIEEYTELIDYRAKKLERKFGYPVPPYPDYLLNVKGYMSLDTQQTELAKMFFEYAIKYYPESANAYDSMSEFYERTEDYKNAIAFAEKAFKISGSDYHKERIKALKEKQ